MSCSPSVRGPNRPSLQRSVLTPEMIRFCSLGSVLLFQVMCRVSVTSDGQYRPIHSFAMRAILCSFLGCMLPLIYIRVTTLYSLGSMDGFEVPWYRDHDFGHEYTTAELVLRGRNPYGIKLADQYEKRGFTSTFNVPEASAPPGLALLLCPLTLLEPLQAFVVWSIIQITCTLAGVTLLLGYLRIGAIDASLRNNSSTPVLSETLWRTKGIRDYMPYAGVIACALLYFPLVDHVRYGQTQSLIFLLCVVGALLIAHGKAHQKSGAFILGFASSIKIFTLPLVFLTARYIGRSGLFWFVIGFIAPPALVSVLCGPEAIVDFITKSIPSVTQTWPSNFSLSGALMAFEQALYGTEVIGPRWLQLFSLCLFAPALWLEYRCPPNVIGSSVFILTLCCLLSPIAWPHYLILTLGALVFLLYHSMFVDCRARLLLATLLLYLLPNLGFFFRPSVGVWNMPAYLLMVLATLFFVRNFNSGTSCPRDRRS